MEMQENARDFAGQEFPESRSSATRPIATGARLVILREHVVAQTEFVRDVCKGVDPKYEISSFEPDLETLPVGGIVFEELGLAVIEHEETDMASSLSAALANQQEVEDSLPEFYAFAIQSPRFLDTRNLTWGLQAINAHKSQFTGHGVKVAVLDTGIDTRHPDLAGSVSSKRSFVRGENVDDLNGHGTHCAGTIVGNQTLGGSPQYGVAPQAELLVGKVLSNSGAGRQRDILAGIVWAVREGARVISISLGSPAGVGAPHNPAYERAASYALKNDSLVIAAAGNDSDRRFRHVAPVSSPADSPSAVAVAAVDQALIAADFSNGGINGGGGTISLAAPGAHVFSSWPSPRRYRSKSGTSVACPHVAGVAALEVEANNIYGNALRTQMENRARKIGGSVQDVGMGLVQSP